MPNLTKSQRTRKIIALIITITAASTLFAETIPIRQLPAVENDNLIEALEAFNISCQVYEKTPAEKIVLSIAKGERAPAPDTAKVQEICREASILWDSKPNNSQVLNFFDRYFLATMVSSDTSPAKLTAYYEPFFEISTSKVIGKYDYPLYSPPASLKDRPNWYSREQIEKGEANEELKDNIIGYTDRWAAYVLQVQGSGIGKTKDGHEFKLEYSARNGHPYRSIGSLLVQRGDIPQDSISMATIESWLDSHSQAEKDSLYWHNPSYIFFKISEKTPNPNRIGPPGAMNLERGLMPSRSAAVDWAHFTPGLPLYIVGTIGRQEKIARLVIAHDRGGAIKNRTRIDLFLGSGDKAKLLAGNTADTAAKLWALQLK